MSTTTDARPPAATRLAVVVHPEHRSRLPAAREALASFEDDAACSFETTGHAGDADAIREFAHRSRADVVVAAGGDGTVSTVADALSGMQDDIRPDLGILPLGTANNLARSFGLLSVRTHGNAAVEQTLRALHDGRIQKLDLGRANGRTFAGSFALGMDSAILHRRNELRARYSLGTQVSGYPLYLASCAIEAIAHREIDASIVLDGQHTRTPIYNLLVTCCPVYAGEFRFAGPAGNPAGQFAAYVFGSRVEFLGEYTKAWRRHVRHQRGEAAPHAQNERWVQHVAIDLPNPAVAQLDGEETEPCARWNLTIRRAAIALRAPLELENARRQSAPARPGSISTNGSGA